MARDLGNMQSGSARRPCSEKLKPMFAKLADSQALPGSLCPLILTPSLQLRTWRLCQGPHLAVTLPNPETCLWVQAGKKWVNKGYGASRVLQGCESARNKGEVRAKKALLGSPVMVGSHGGTWRGHEPSALPLI